MLLHDHYIVEYFCELFENYSVELHRVELTLFSACLFHGFFNVFSFDHGIDQLFECSAFHSHSFKQIRMGNLFLWTRFDNNNCFLN